MNLRCGSLNRRIALVVLAWGGLTGCSVAPQASVTVLRYDDAVAVTVSPAPRVGELDATRQGARVIYRLPLPATPSPHFRVLTMDQPAGEVTVSESTEGGSVLSLTMDDEYPIEVEQGRLDVTLRIPIAGDRVTTRPIGDEATLTSIQRCRPDGVRWIHVAEISAGLSERVRLRLAGKSLTARKPLPELAQGALVAINGGYFDPGTGAAVGAVKLDGEWIRRGVHRRTALLLAVGERPRIAPVTWRGTVRDGRRQLPIDILNGRPGPGAACVVTTPRFDLPPVFPGYLATPVPSRPGWTVYTRQPLDGVPEVTLRSEPDVDGSLLGAGPTLVRGGEVRVTETYERFRPDVTDTVTARAGIGLRDDGSMLFVLVGGHRPHSRGSSLEDFAELFRELGCDTAMNLDGTHSATLCVNGKLVGEPMAGYAVPVPNALVVLPR